MAPVSASTDPRSGVELLIGVFVFGRKRQPACAGQQGIVRRGSGWVVHRCREDLHRKCHPAAGRANLRLYRLTIYLCLNQKPQMERFAAPAVGLSA